MASQAFFAVLAVLAVVVLSMQLAQGKITCEKLNKDTCAFAVSSFGMRCVLEKHVTRGGIEKYTCGTSRIEADNVKDWVESDACIGACGLDRRTLGISSDSLLEPNFAKKLCSDQCYRRCPNVVDLYFNLAAGEGVYLPKLCEARGTNARREMSEIKSSGLVPTKPAPTVVTVRSLATPSAPPPMSS